MILYIWPHEEPPTVVSVTWTYVGEKNYFNFFANFAYF